MAYRVNDMNEQRRNALVDAEADARQLAADALKIADRFAYVSLYGNDPDIHDEVRALVPLAASVDVQWQMSRAFGMAREVAQ